MWIRSRLFRRKEPTESPKDRVAATRAPGVCYQCGKALSHIAGGTYSGAAIKGRLSPRPIRAGPVGLTSV